MVIIEAFSSNFRSQLLRDEKNFSTFPTLFLDNSFPAKTLLGVILLNGCCVGSTSTVKYMGLHLLQSYNVDALSGPLHGFLAAKTDQCAAMQNKKVDVTVVGFTKAF